MPVAGAGEVTETRPSKVRRGLAPAGARDRHSADGDLAPLCSSTAACFFSSTSSCSRITDVLASRRRLQAPQPSSSMGPCERGCVQQAMKSAR